jgi:hypothetical protein
MIRMMADGKSTMMMMAMAMTPHHPNWRFLGE